MPCYRICRFNFTTDYNNMRELRTWWEKWDLRILVLYMFISQLYLLFFGRHRRKNASPLMTIVSIWLLYLFADLLATIALGKLSKIKLDEKDKAEHALRVLWAPLILFYLGGPDTITVLRAEENKLWVRHLIGLLTQGVRATYVLIVTWDMKGLSLLALLVFVPGIIKYGERVWVVKSRSKSNYKGFVHLDLSIPDNFSGLGSNVTQVLQAYSWFQTLMPHNLAYKCDPSNLSILVTKFHKSVREDTVDAFKLIEIELGLIYDMLFSKVGTIFTLWGSILRFLSFSLIVSVLVIFLKCHKPPGHLEGDHPITIILLVGAIFLELAGVVVQLVSDWAMVWACKNLRPLVKTSSFHVQDTGLSPTRDSSSKWATSVLFLHEYLISKRQRWSGVIGQFSLGDFRMKYKPTMCNNTWECLFGREKMLKRFSSQLSPLQHLKDLIINHLLEKSEEVAVVDTLHTPAEEVVEKSKEAIVVDTSQTLAEKVAVVGTSQTPTEEVAVVDTLHTLAEEVAEEVAVVDTPQTPTEEVAVVDTLHTPTEEVAKKSDEVAVVDTSQTPVEEVVVVDTLHTPAEEVGEKSEKVAIVDTLQTPVEVAVVDTLHTPAKKVAEKSEEVKVVDTSQTPTDEVVVVDTLHTLVEEIAEKSEKVTVANTSQTPAEEVAKKSKEVADVDKLPILAMTRGGWTLSRYNLMEQLKWSIDLEFDQSVVIWHLATQVRCDSDHPKIGKDEDKLKVIKILSDYMMYLLVTCPDTFPFCNNYDKITEELFGEGLTSTNPKGLERHVNKAQKLVQALEGNSKKWEIMGGVWVEMLCYAAEKCPVKNHIQELRHGGEFLTHVWLLLMHFGVPKIVERDRSGLKNEKDSGINNVGVTGEEVVANMIEEARDGINVTREELALGGKVGDWTIQSIC